MLGTWLVPVNVHPSLPLAWIVVPASELVSYPPACLLLPTKKETSIGLPGQGQKRSLLPGWILQALSSAVGAGCAQEPGLLPWTASSPPGPELESCHFSSQSQQGPVGPWALLEDAETHTHLKEDEII